jgi:hypothetical protein
MCSLLIQSNFTREQLKRNPGCRFVPRREFCDLLVSHRTLLRDDVATADVRGLYEPETDTWFLIEEEELFGDDFPSI